MNEDKLNAALNAAVKGAKDFEGWSPVVYEDTEGHPTIWFGRNLDVYPFAKEEGEVWLKMMMERIATIIADRIWYLGTLPEAVQALLIDMAYNIGVSGLMKFKKMLAAIEDYDWHKAAEELKDSKYYHQTGRRAKAHYNTLKGLTDEL